MGIKDMCGVSHRKEEREGCGGRGRGECYLRLSGATGAVGGCDVLYRIDKHLPQVSSLGVYDGDGRPPADLLLVDDL